MFAVIGATGKTGRVVAESLLAAGADVLAIGRSAERLQPLVEKGAQAYAGSADDAQAMSIALSGAVAAYCLLPPRYSVPDYRAHQREVGEALAAAIHGAGVQHVVFLSSIGAQQSAGTGPIVGLREQEIRLGKLKGANVLCLRPGWVMDNLYLNVGRIRGSGILSTPIAGEIPLAMVSAHDIGKHAAERLMALDFEGLAVQELLGPRDVTLQEATRAIGEAIGRTELKYEQMPLEEFESAAMGSGMSQGTASVFAEMYRGINAGLVVPEETRSTANATPMAIEEFARCFAQVYSAASG